MTHDGYSETMAKTQQQVLRLLVLCLIMIVHSRAWILQQRNTRYSVELMRRSLLEERVPASQTMANMRLSQRRILQRGPDRSRSLFSPEMRRHISCLTVFSSTTENVIDGNEDDDGTDNDEDTAESIENSSTFTPGVPKGFFIVDHITTPLEGFDMVSARERLGASEVYRLNLTSDNITLPIALMLLDPETHPSFSRARKACRKGYILIHRGPLSVIEIVGGPDVFDPQKCIRGRVGDRVYAGDVIAKQVRMGNGLYNAQYHEKPPFDLPVVYEDDHFAIVNKPAGVVTYAHRGAGHGRMSVKSALPFVVKAPKAQTFSVISRPIACHRLDRPTSGLLVVAKTKPAMVHLTQQFAERKVKKTYTAIVNGIPDEAAEATMTSEDAHKLGVDVNADDESSWQVIDFTLDDKHAITLWRPLRYVKSLKARNGVLTLVELKPKTGRYHQLRRHMAWVCACPLVGDKTYDGGGDAMAFRERGLFLCSNRVIMEHPYYNTDVGRKEWETLDDDSKFGGGMLSLSQDGIVRVTAAIDLPTKFENFLKREEARSSKF